MRAGLAPEHVGAGRIFLEDRQFAPDARPQRQREGRRAERQRQDARQGAELQTHDGIGEEDRAPRKRAPRSLRPARPGAKRSPGGRQMIGRNSDQPRQRRRRTRPPSRAARAAGSSEARRRRRRTRPARTARRTAAAAPRRRVWPRRRRSDSPGTLRRATTAPTASRAATTTPSLSKPRLRTRGVRATDAAMGLSGRRATRHAGVEGRSLRLGRAWRAAAIRGREARDARAPWRRPARGRPAPAITHFRKPFDFRKSSATALAGSPSTWTRALSSCSVARSSASKIGLRMSAILGLACSAASRMIGVGL